MTGAHPTGISPGAHPTGISPGAHPTGISPGAHPTDAHLLQAFVGTELPDHVAEKIAAGEVPGVTLFRHHNVTSAAQLRALTDAIQAARPAGTAPLLIAVDQEGGQFLALGDDSTPFAGNLALGAAADPDLAERVGEAIGREAAACGANVVYAPVCDVITDPSNPALGIRAFGDDPSAAGPLAAALVRGLRSAGVAATLKHFPGKGAVAVDTHHELGIVEAAREQVDARELRVFRDALAAEPEMVMSGHFAVPALTGRTDLPATLAREVMTDLLRTELGFRGVTITDALDMKALSQGAGQIVDALAALRAGVDLLLCGPDEAANEQLQHGLRLAWERRLIDPDQLGASARRIEGLRRYLGTVQQPEVRVVGSDDHRALAEELARRSITLVRDNAGLVPLPIDSKILVVQPQPRDLTPADTTSTVPPSLGQIMAARFTGVQSIVVPDPPTPEDIAAVVAAAQGVDRVVLGVSAASLEPAQAELASAVLSTGTATAVVILRAPADLAVLADAPTVLCSYGVLAPSLEALADVLSGVRPAPGHLPVTPPGGDGP